MTKPPLSSPVSEEKSDSFPNEAIYTSSSPLVPLGLGPLTSSFTKRIQRMGFHDHDHTIPLHLCGSWCCDTTIPPSPFPSREKGRKVERQKGNARENAKVTKTMTMSFLFTCLSGSGWRSQGRLHSHLLIEEESEGRDD